MSRASARAFAKARHPGEHMSPYRCGDFWHIGHMQPARANGTHPATDRRQEKPTPTPDAARRDDRPTGEPR